MFVFIVYRTVSFLTIITIQAKRNRSELFKIITVYLNKGPVVYYVCVCVCVGGGGQKVCKSSPKFKIDPPDNVHSAHFEHYVFVIVNYSNKYGVYKQYLVSSSVDILRLCS